MSRHGRRGTQGDDDQWGPGEYTPQDADEPYAPGDYGQARRDWSRQPIATADTGDFPVTNSSLPPVSYPRSPASQPGEAFDWGPDPLGVDSRGRDARGAGSRGREARGFDRPGYDQPGFDQRGYDQPGFDQRGYGPSGYGPSGYGPSGYGPSGYGQPGGGASRPAQPEPMAPERWAPQSWEPPSRDRASWDSEPASPAGWLNPSQPAPDWAEHGDLPGGFDDVAGGELPPLPPGPLPGSGHPSGPLPPLPESDYLWGEPSPDPQPPSGRRSRRAGRDQDQPGRSSRHGGPPAGTGPDPAGYPEDVAGYAAGPAGYPEDPAGYPDNPAAYPPEQDEPAGYRGRSGRRRRRRGAPPEVGAGQPGYEGYVDDPRDLDMAPDQGQESRDYARSEGWYPDEEEPQAWAEEGFGGDLLPGLDPEQGSRGGAGGGSGGKARKKKRRRVRTILLAIAAVFILAVAAAGGVGYHYYREYIDPPDFSGPGTGSVLVQIKPGQFADQIGLTLASDGVVASARAFSNAAKANPRGNALEPGYYRVHRHMKASLALALLLNPASRQQIKVLIPEGFRVAQIIQRLGQETGNLKGYEQAIAHPSDLGLPAFAGGKPEGYLFPATYEIQPNTSPAAVLKAMVTKFKQNAQSIGLAGGSARAHESQLGVITVASLIEAEGKPQNFRQIAEVIYNRLNMNMKLQLDTTVLYAMALAHKSGSKFSTTFPSPYNTYVHANLPPGPIDNPGNAAIQAALRPDHGNKLYFLTINKSGKTLFFSTAAAFDNAVQMYGSTGTGTGSHTGSG